MKEDQPGVKLYCIKEVLDVTSDNSAETEVLLWCCCGQLVGPPCQPHVEHDQRYNGNKNRPLLGGNVKKN